MRRQGNPKMDWASAVTVMKANPHEWHKLGAFSPGVAYWLRSGACVAFGYSRDEDPKAGMTRDWEITTRTADDKDRPLIYARFIGV